MLTKNNNKTLFQNENVDLHSDCIIQINNFHDELLKEKTNYIILDNKHKGLQSKYNTLEKDNEKNIKKIEKLEINYKDLETKYDKNLLDLQYLSSNYIELNQWRKSHNCIDNINMEEIKKDVIKEIDLKETKEYIDLKSINESYNKKIINLESKIEKINLNIEDNILFKQVKEQNNVLLESNSKLDIQVKELNKKIIKMNKPIENKKDIKQDAMDEQIVFDTEIENKYKDPVSKNKNINDININDKIIKENINKIIMKIDKLYSKNFTDEQITINKSLIAFYSKIYNKIKDKDEKKDIIYINEIIDSASTDTNRARFKKILKVSYFINNHEYLINSNIVIPLYMFKAIPVNSMDNLFSNITEHFKDKIIMDDDNN